MGKSCLPNLGLHCSDGLRPGEGPGLPTSGQEFPLFHDSKRKALFAAVALATALVGTTGVAQAGTQEYAGPTGSKAPGRVDSMPVRILSSFQGTGSQQCLDADANNGANGTKVQTWDCNGTSQQRWYWWDDGSLESYRFPGKCLDADTNGGGANGTRVQLWDCNHTTQQRWFTRANDVAIYNYRFYNGGNTVVDRDANVAGNGAQVQLWVKNYQSQQWWRINRD
ncbi:RICIN domain-containing protein [Kitasatospora sp. NPDC004240]